MRKLFEKIWKREEGFTLIELIIVIAILAIISAIAIPNVLSAVDNSRRTTDVTNAKMIADAVATIRAQNETYHATIGNYDLKEAGFSAEILKALNNSEPIPKYKGTTATEDQFVVSITAGAIVVYVDDTDMDANGSTGIAGDAVQVYPDSSAYANQ